MGRGLCKPTLETMHGGTCLLYMTYHTISLPPEDSQFLSTREFNVEEICRIFRVPPHMVQDLKRSTYSNIEHQAIDYVQHTLSPWLIRIEQAIIKDVLIDKEKDVYFPKFNVDGLLRGDYKSRMEGYAIGFANGFLSPNEIRRFENWDPIPEDDCGDVYVANGSYVRLRDIGVAYGANAVAVREKQAAEEEASPKETEEAESEPDEAEEAEEAEDEGEQKESKGHAERRRQRKAARRGGNS